MTKNAYGRKFPCLVFSMYVDRLLKSLSTNVEFFLCYVNISIHLFETMGHSRGCTAGCMGKISHTNLKIRIVIFRNRNFKNSYSTTNPWSDLRPDL